MAQRSSLLAICAALCCLVAPRLSLANWEPQQVHSAAVRKGELLHTVRRQLLQDQEDVLRNLEASSTRRLRADETTVPLAEGSPYAVGLPDLSSLNGIITEILSLAESTVTLGHFPFESFPDLGTSSNRYGFAPTNDSFCLFASNGKGTKPGSAAAAGAYPGPGIPNTAGYTPPPYYNGNYNGYGGYGHYSIVDLRTPAPSATFPYGLPPKLASLLDVFGAELHCLLGPILPDSAPPFPVFLEVLLEDAAAVFGQFLKYLSGGLIKLPGVGNLDSDLIYLRDPLNPYGTPLKFEFSLAQSPFPVDLLNTVIPYPEANPEDVSATPTWTAPDVNPGISPVAGALPAGDDVRAVGYDGYLDSCQVILGSQPGSDGTFDKVNDFAGTINDGAWSVPLTTLVNNTGDVAYVVPAAKSNNYGELTLATRKSAGYCYDIATLQPVYNPLAVPIPDGLDIYNASLAASPLTTILVFGNAFGLDQSGLKTAFGIDQAYDVVTYDALDQTMKDPYGAGSHIYRENIKIQNTVTLGATLLTNDSSTYASFAVLLDQAVARAAVGATNQLAANGFNVSGPALNLDSATSIQDIYYGAKSWVATTSDPTLPAALSSAAWDARTIYAAALAATNINAAADHAENATDIQTTGYYTQAVIVPQLEDVISGASTVDEFMALTTPEALDIALANTELPGSLTIPPAVAPVVPVDADTSTQAATREASKHHGLSGGAIAGIVIGCVAGVGLIAAAAVLLAQRMRARSYSEGRV